MIENSLLSNKSVKLSNKLINMKTLCPPLHLFEQATKHPLLIEAESKIVSNIPFNHT